MIKWLEFRSFDEDRQVFIRPDKVIAVIPYIYLDRRETQIIFDGGTVVCVVGDTNTVIDRIREHVC